MKIELKIHYTVKFTSYLFSPILTHFIFAGFSHRKVETIFRLFKHYDKCNQLFYLYPTQISLLSTESIASNKPDGKCKPAIKSCLDHQQQTSCSSSATGASSTASSSSPPFSPGYEELKESSKMHYLTVRKLSDDEFSEADSMTR